MSSLRDVVLLCLVWFSCVSRWLFLLFIGHSSHPWKRGLALPLAFLPVMVGSENYKPGVIASLESLRSIASCIWLSCWSCWWIRMFILTWCASALCSQTVSAGMFGGAVQFTSFISLGSVPPFIPLGSVPSLSGGISECLEYFTSASIHFKCSRNKFFEYTRWLCPYFLSFKNSSHMHT